MYLGLPWLIAIVLALTAQYDEHSGGSPGHPIVRGSVIVMLGSSFLIGEGIVCVLMFLPIFLLVAAIVSAVSNAKLAGTNTKQHSVHLIPLLIALCALEGTHPNLSFERQGSVTVRLDTALNQQQLWANLTQPMFFNRATPSGLAQLFPQPVRVDAQSFEVGAVHTVHYRYARWLWTNIHEGSMQLRIDARTPDSVNARVINNTSYLANYLDVQRISVQIVKGTAGGNQVAMRIDYRRTLDPAWYFSPLMRLALRGTANHIVRTHILQKG